MGALTVEEAQARVVALVRHGARERVGIRDALGRVLAEDVRATSDLPGFDNSAMDGFAVRAADVQTVPALLTIVGEVVAGQRSAPEVQPGQACQIMTGAQLPDGADAVVMVERTEPAGDRVRILESVRLGENVRRRGEEVAHGEMVLQRGVRLGAAELGVLVGFQRTEVVVARAPEVAILVTGDELRAVGEPLVPGTLPDTNSHVLSALVLEAGGRPRVLPIVRDDRVLLREAISEAASADLVISTGGVSVGARDYVKEVLAELGAELAFWRVSMKPGKPVAVAELGRRPFLGLPGNPVSAVVSFHLFVRPAIRAMLGASEPFDLPRLEVVLDSAVRSSGERRTYLRAALWVEHGEIHARPMSKQGSHMLTSLVGANGLLVQEAGSGGLAAGDKATALLIGPLQ